MFKKNDTVFGVLNLSNTLNLSSLFLLVIILTVPTKLEHLSLAATLPQLARINTISIGNKPPDSATKDIDTSTINQYHINLRNDENTSTSLPLKYAILQQKQKQLQQELLLRVQEEKTQKPTTKLSVLAKPTQYNISNKTRRSLFNQDLNSDCEFTVSRKPAIYGIRCDTCDYHDDGAIIIRAHYATKIFLIGKNLYSNISVALTAIDGSEQDDCTHNDRIKTFQLYNRNLNVGEIEIELASQGMKIPYYFCIREAASATGWFHQGSESWLKLYVKQDILPLYGKLLIVALLLSLSGTFSGLNLGLMSLDKNDLQVIMKCGSEDEKRYAKMIEPVRRRGNYLLCSILFSNTLVNSTISVLLEDLSGGLVAIMFSTILIVLFGEILPQAFCSRHGLAVGAKTIWLTQACMVITAPLSYPVSWCLDLALGDELGHVYDRERLMEFINLTREYNQLEAAEVNIISGALKLKQIEVREIMTKIDDVYMLDETACLDYPTIQAIHETGYSRIPIHRSGDRTEIFAVLFAKDLAIVDPDDKTPILTITNFYKHPIIYLADEDKLDYALTVFKSGQAHMAIVRKVVYDGDKDPYYENLGIVTLEDVIEEIMQIEINDETDTLTDNRCKRRRKDAQVRTDFSHFTNLGSGDAYYKCFVSPKQTLAAYQHLATTVEPFTAKYLSDSVLKRLLLQKIYYKVKMDDDEKMKSLYVAGKPADYFIMILEGRVQVTCGQEHLRSYMGPFDCFGKSVLMGLLKLNPAIVGGDLATNSDVETTPQHSSLHQQQRQPLLSSRRESIAPKSTSRRESLTKVITDQLSLSMRKLTDQIQPAQYQQAHGPTDSSPSMAVAMSDSSPTSATVAKLNAAEITRPYYSIPDYTVYVIADTSYLKITTKDYLTSLRATASERSPAGVNQSDGIINRIETAQGNSSNNDDEDEDDDEDQEREQVD